MIISTVSEFCKYFSIGRPLISIDYGLKKIGLAISTPDHTMSFPYQILVNKGEKAVIKDINEIIMDKNICAIVIGLPLKLDGTSSEQTTVTENFASQIEKEIKLPIFMQDERLTSRAADNYLKNFGLSRKQRNKCDDLTSASLILETVLESARKIMQTF